MLDNTVFLRCLNGTHTIKIPRWNVKKFEDAINDFNSYKGQEDRSGYIYYRDFNGIFRKEYELYGSVLDLSTFIKKWKEK